MTTNSYLRSAPRPSRPTTSSVYFCRLDFPVANSWSCTRPIRSGDAYTSPLVAVSSAMSEPALAAIPVQRATDAGAKRHARCVADLRPGARDVEGAALREES